MDISRKIKEAELYYAMGMLDESLLVYEALLVNGFSERPEDTRLIEEKAQELKREINALNKGSSCSLSSEEILLIKKTISSKGDAIEHLDSAAAFLELGLPREAAAGYEKVLHLEQGKHYWHVQLLVKQESHSSQCLQVSL